MPLHKHTYMRSSIDDYEKHSQYATGRACCQATKRREGDRARGSIFLIFPYHRPPLLHGDTCTVTLNDPFLPGVLWDHIPVRLAGIDTPELKGDCAAERALPIQALDFLVARLATAARVELHAPARDKYFRFNGRLLARRPRPLPRPHHRQPRAPL